jgi:TPR repeat protein
MAIEEYLATKPAPDALLARARQYAQGGDLPEAFLIWRAAAEAGNPQAELEVAGFYDPTLPAKTGFTPDGARAADWYERAALAGNAEAQRKYGMLLARGGAGLAADPAKARTWLQQAADQKDAEAKKALDSLPK